ncbi:MAG: hypothetical protein WB511_07515 [Nitrososphaeraceae archaeon]
MGNASLVFAQNGNTPNISNDSRNIIIKYCVQFANSVSKGMNVIQDLIGVGQSQVLIMIRHVKMKLTDNKYYKLLGDQ